MEVTAEKNILLFPAGAQALADSLWESPYDWDLPLVLSDACRDAGMEEQASFWGFVGKGKLSPLFHPSQGQTMILWADYIDDTPRVIDHSNVGTLLLRRVQEICGVTPGCHDVVFAWEKNVSRFWSAYQAFFGAWVAEGKPHEILDCE